MRTALLNFAIFLPLAASAQDTVTKTGTNYFVQTEGRESAVCGVEFVILYRDATYRKGAPAMITGSLSWLEIKGEFTLILKIAGMDFENSSPSNPAPFRMSSAFLSTKNESPRMTGTQCEDRRTFCGSLALPASLSALDALNEGTLRIGF